MAQVKSIEFDDEERPEVVTLRLTVEEAAFIATFTGDQSSITSEEVMPNGGAVASSALYNALTNYVFAPYWDGAVEEYRATRRLHT